MGDKLSGTDETGTEVIQITAIGEECILARRIVNYDGVSVRDPECGWTLRFREWKLANEA